MIVDAIVALLLVLGGVFGLVGSYGLVKLPDLMTRLHAPTKATTLGVGGVLIASMIHFAVSDGLSLHELLVALFLFLTAPITANFVAKAWLHRHSGPEALPPTGGERGWANYDPPPDDD
jgi:multicomponent K+:H+ antiporter subunit G